MSDTTAKIRAKGLDATGVTEEIANQYYASKGRHFMFIGEYKVDETHDKADGHKGVDLVITQIEPATEQILEDHLRQLTRTLHQNRALKSQDVELPIDGQEDLEPKVEDVIAARRAHDASQPHVFDSDDNDDAAPRCLTCGETQDDDLHTVLADPDVDDPADGADDQDDAPAPDDPAFDLHPFTGTEGYACEACEQPEDSAIHTTADQTADDTTKEPVPVA